MGAERGVKKVGEKNEGGREEEEAALNCWYNKRLRQDQAWGRGQVTVGCNYDP